MTKNSCKGKFITIEGGEASGKSTQIELLKEVLKNKNVIFTREPGGTNIANEIRKILTLGATNKIQPITELLLLYAARNEHINELIKPSLLQGKTVICDRFTDSTFAYQSYGLGLNKEIIDIMNNLILGNFKADKTILLDIDPQIAHDRIIQRKKDEDERYEKFSIDFHQNIRDGYLTLAKQDPNRFNIIDATQSQQVISQQILEIILD